MQSLGRHTDPPTVHRSFVAGDTNSKGEHGPSYRPAPSINPSPLTRSRTINVVLFGETGAGKGSVINLIAGEEIADVSWGFNGGTMQYKRYELSLGDMDLAIFDTISLEEPQMRDDEYLNAIGNAYDLVNKLATAGGIDLLLFCIRRGRVTATMLGNYRLFWECLCNSTVPIALVFTGFEREAQTEEWWGRNKEYMESYGINSDSHACITAIKDDASGDEIEASQEAVRELLRTRACKGGGFSREPHSWFARLAMQMEGFVWTMKCPVKKDIMKVLTHRCKLDADIAKRVADMMGRGETGPLAVNGKGGHAECQTNGDAPPSERDDAEAVSGVVANGERENVVECAPRQGLGNVKTAPAVISNEVMDKGKDTRVRTVAKDPPFLELGNFGAALGSILNGG